MNEVSDDALRAGTYLWWLLTDLAEGGRLTDAQIMSRMEDRGAPRVSKVRRLIVEAITRGWVGAASDGRRYITPEGAQALSKADRGLPPPTPSRERKAPCAATARAAMVARPDQIELLTQPGRRMHGSTHADLIPLPVRPGALDFAALPSRRGSLRVWPDGRCEVAR